MSFFSLSLFLHRAVCFHSTSNVLPKALNVAMCSSGSSGCLGRGCHTRPSTSCLRQMHGISDGLTVTVKRYWLVARFTCGETSRTSGSAITMQSYSGFALATDESTGFIIIIPTRLINIYYLNCFTFVASFHFILTLPFKPSLEFYSFPLLCFSCIYLFHFPIAPISLLVKYLSTNLQSSSAWSGKLNCFFNHWCLSAFVIVVLERIPHRHGSRFLLMGY